MKKIQSALNQQSMSGTASFDTVIVGSGPGGATLAKELVEKGQKVVVLEWGDFAPLKGSFMQMAGIAAIPGKGAFVGSDLSLLLRGITAGGSSAINFATAMAPPVEFFKKYNIDLTEEIVEVRQQLPLGELPHNLIGPMAQKIKESAQAIGLKWEKLEKFIYKDKCRINCYRCTYGCPYDAKWNARMFLHEAIEHGAQLIEKAKVLRVITENNRAVGVEYSHEGQIKIIRANKVALAAGGIGSPRILEATGISNAGKDYFVDPAIAVMGSVKGINSAGEVPMVAGLHLPSEGIMLSDLTLPKPLFQAFSAQVGRVDRLFSHSSTLTIMVKAKDNPGGRIGPKWINKRLSSKDKEKLDRGATIAEEILHEAQASSIFRTHHFAAHPGGSARIGKVVDSDLQSKIAGLYVCDASIIPGPWGLPPTYTLICLAKRLAKHLTRH